MAGFRPRGSIVQFKWQETPEGREFLGGILHRNKRKSFGMPCSKILIIQSWFWMYWWFFLIFRITWDPKLTAATSRRKFVLQDLLNGEASCWKNEYCSKAVRARYCNYQAELCGKLIAVNISCFVDVWRCVNREFCVVL